MGPRGTLLADSTGLRWKPDRYEAARGDSEFAWRWPQLRCASRTSYRDITGLQGIKLVLQVPEGRLELVAFHESGSSPGRLSSVS